MSRKLAVASGHSGQLFGLQVLMALAVLCSLVVRAHFDQPGWDLHIYHSAVQALAAGHDPYADAIARQRVYHAAKTLQADAVPPYSYVYSPVTLPVLRLLARVPEWFSGGVYWSIYALAVLAQLWVGLQATSSRERTAFLFLAPASIYFPGLLEDETVLSGNIAFLLYALVFGAAIYAWKGGSWRWFYGTVLMASCVKAPLLSLVVIPVLSARRQWVPATLTALGGLGLFLVQPRIWPQLFKNYMEAVQLQFTYNRDFGCSPAGLFSGVLYDRGTPYVTPGLIFYLAYAIPLFAVLLFLSRYFLSGRLTLKQWMPVLLVGVILLNPRLMEYDVAPIALLLALIAWRAGRALVSARVLGVGFAVLFLALNLLASTSWMTRKLIDGPLLSIILAAGCWHLTRIARGTNYASAPA